jgi:hypothetical protein
MQTYVSANSPTPHVAVAVLFVEIHRRCASMALKWSVSGNPVVQRGKEGMNVSKCPQTNLLRCAIVKLLTFVGPRLGYVVLMLFGVAPSVAQEIQVSHAACAANVQLTARNAPLYDVLKQLSASLDFKLQFEGSSDAVVDMTVSMPAAELVPKLSGLDSIIVAQSRDPNCPNQNRIDKVWVLAKGEVGNTRSPPAPATPNALARNVDEMARQAREAYQTYIQLHGKPPPGAEEEISKPK